MDQVLCIDLSLEPARAALVSVEQRKLKIVESRQFSVASELKLSDLLEYSYVEGSHHENGATTEEGSEESAKETVTEQSAAKIRPAAPLNSLVAAIKDLPKTWINSVLIIPMSEYLSLNLTLPFADQKNIAKILDFEVQDVVPFEVDEFLIEGHALSALGPNQHDVHVSLAPKRFIGNLLTLCRASGIEPSIITTPCSALAALPHLASEYFKDTFALISITPQGVYLCASIDNQVRADKVITANGLPASEDPQWFIPELKLTLMALEKRYGKTFGNVYVDAPKKIIATLQQTLGRSVEPLELSDFAGEDHRDSAASALSALYAGDEETLKPLTNFRVREFSFRPNWGALLRSLSTIKIYFFGLVGLLLATLFIVYQVRQLQISRLRGAVQDQIRATVPNIKGGAGNEVPAFFGELQALSKELESLGSSNEISPMNILVELTKDLKDLEKTTINEIDIRPDRVLLDLSLPDYAAADRVEKLLKRKKELFRRVRKEASAYTSSSGGRNFNFELKLFD